MSVTQTKNFGELLQINGGVRRQRGIKEVDFIMDFMDVNIISYFSSEQLISLSALNQPQKLQQTV